MRHFKEQRFLDGKINYRQKKFSKRKLKILTDPETQTTEIKKETLIKS